MRRSHSWVAVVVALTCGVCSVRAAAAGLVWPGSELSQHAQAWFAMLQGDAPAARKFFAEHMAPAAMAEAGIDERLQRRAATLERTGGLEPLEVVDEDGNTLAVRCKAGNGDLVVAMFEAEPAPPHRILGVRLEARPPGDGGPPPRPAGPPLDDAEGVKQVRAFLDKRAAAGEYSGVTLLARGDQVLMTGAWGLADRDRKTANTPGTRFNRDYLELIRDQPLWFAPGTRERYSNGGYVLLGEVVAKVSGEDYYDYLAKHVFGPANMNSTSAPIEGDGTKGLARGYTKQGASAGERDNAATRPARGSAAGGSCSTAADLLAFDRALLGGKLCGRAWSDWAAGGPRPAPGVPSSPAAPSGQGFGFAGGAPGLNAEWLREGDVVLIVLTNRDPETARPTVQGVQDIVRRMKPAAKRGRS